MSERITIGVPEWVDRVCVWPMIIYRRWKYGYSFRRIYLGEGIFAIVEPGDFYRVNYYHWSPRRNSNCVYAVRFENGKGRKNKIVSMHRELMKAPRGKLVDHRNGLTLDNRMENLRLATRCENQYNKTKTSRKTSSRYIGVYREKRSGLWATKISSHGKSVWLGRFETEEAAARAYDEGARKYHGEFAKLNFTP